MGTGPQKPRREAFSILDPAVIEQPIYRVLSATAPLREPLHLMARQHACGGEGSAFPINPHFETLLKAACSDAQSPSLYPERARQWLGLPGSTRSLRDLFVAWTPGVNPVATG